MMTARADDVFSSKSKKADWSNASILEGEYRKWDRGWGAIGKFNMKPKVA